MADDKNVPATVQGTWQYDDVLLAIGDDTYAPSVDDRKNSYWFLVVDLSSLDVVVNEISRSNETLPAEVQKYVGQNGYLLVVASAALRTDNVPQGALYKTLRAMGAGVELARAEQINEQLGTGSIGHMSYILVATTDAEDSPGFEEFSFTDRTVMTFEFLPVTIDGKTTYAPVRLSA